jgi:hypothetical protein
LTADLILRSPQYFNAVREREIDLRGELFHFSGTFCICVHCS